MNYRLKHFLIDFAVYSAVLVGVVLYITLMAYVMGINILAGFILLGVSLAAIFAALDNFVL